MVRTRTEVDTCRDCGRPFGPDLPKVPRYKRCPVCHRKARRQHDRAYYLRHNADRLSLPSGRKLGQANAPVMQTAEIADRIAEQRERSRIKLEQLPRELQRVCMFCDHQKMEGSVLTVIRCGLDLVPDSTGGCDRWKPQYRTDDEDD